MFGRDVTLKRVREGRPPRQINSVTSNVRQRLEDRRVNSERRSGEATHSAEEMVLRERRVNPDRRFPARRLGEQSKRKNISLYMVVAIGALFGDIYFFDGMHSTDIVQTIARELSSLATQWTASVFEVRS